MRSVPPVKKQMIKNKVNIIGAGLAGCECAYQLANRGFEVNLYEMKPKKYTPAHSYENFGELVCSNSLRSNRLSNAVGLLKEEMRMLGSLIIKAADTTKVPAGGALAVNRYEFSDYITKELKKLSNINIIEEEVVSLSAFEEENTVIASGPLTTPPLFEEIKKLTGEEYLHFFDAAAPIVAYDSIDMENAFFASRYERGSDYINCPMSKEEYTLFYDELIKAQCAEIKEFEQNVFEGCMPVESMAQRGFQTLLFGPLKPKGIKDPKTDRQPYAVVQLRKENVQGSMYNLVGFQTHLKFGEQKRVFSLIPALKNAEFLRYGVMHKNTFLCSPKLLVETYSLKRAPNIKFAGQITGVEGYVESASSGLVCGLQIAYNNTLKFSSYTATGALCKHISGGYNTNFQPMNVNFGIIEPLDFKIKNKEEKNTEISKRALKLLEEIKEKI